MRNIHFVLSSRSDKATFEWVKMQIQKFKKKKTNNTKAEKTVLISRLSTLEEPK